VHLDARVLQGGPHLLEHSGIAIGHQNADWSRCHRRGRGLKAGNRGAQADQGFVGLPGIHQEVGGEGLNAGIQGENIFAVAYKDDRQ
jgi:hypothetical protein